MASTPQYERSGGIGLVLSQVPLAKRKKSEPGATDRSIQLRKRPSVRARSSPPSPSAATAGPRAPRASTPTTAAAALRDFPRDAFGRRSPSGRVDIAHRQAHPALAIHLE